MINIKLIIKNANRETVISSVPENLVNLNYLNTKILSWKNVITFFHVNILETFEKSTLH